MSKRSSPELLIEDIIKSAEKILKYTTGWAPFFRCSYHKKTSPDFTRTSPKSIPVSILLVRTVHIHTDIIRLLNS